MARPKKPKPGAVLRLEGDLTIQEAARLRDGLLAALAEAGEEIRLDLSAVASIDVAGLQLLCATHRGAMQAGKALKHTGPPSEAVREAVRRAGFAREKGCHAEDPHGACLWDKGGTHA